jgi:beta-fructofuranosidase
MRGTLRAMNRRMFLSKTAMAHGAALGAMHRGFRALAETVVAPALKEKLMRDPLRPQFHLLPQADWMNDPCAPRFFRGQYHVFFQYNPAAAVRGTMHWAHAVSPDLMHWKHLPVALIPTPGGCDAAGCFTGSVLPGVELPAIPYTGVTRSSAERETIRGEDLREVQCLATSTDPELRTWTSPLFALPLRRQHTGVKRGRQDLTALPRS